MKCRWEWSHRSHPPQAASITDCHWVCNMRSFHSVRGIILLLTAMATVPFLGSAGCWGEVPSNGASRPWASASLLFYCQSRQVGDFRSLHANTTVSTVKPNRCGEKQQIPLAWVPNRIGVLPGIISARLSVGTPLLFTVAKIRKMNNAINQALFFSHCHKPDIHGLLFSSGPLVMVLLRDYIKGANG